MAGEPWLDYATPEAAPTAEAPPWADYGGSAEEASPADNQANVDYKAHLQVLANSGAQKPEIEDYARSVGIDPATGLHGLDEALAYKATHPEYQIPIVIAGKPTLARETGIAGRGALEGVGSVLDFGKTILNNLSAPALWPIDKRLEPDTMMSGITGAAADAAGLPAPETGKEDMLSTIASGAASGLATGGVLPELGVAANAIGGAAANAAGESAKQAGYGPVVQTILSLLGGIVGGGASMAAEKAAGAAAGRIGPKIAKVLDNTPAEAVLDDAGALNEHGRELAQRAGVPDDVVRQSFARVRSSGGPRRPRPYATPQRRIEALGPVEQAAGDVAGNPPSAPPNQPPPPDLDLHTQRIIDAIGERLAGSAERVGSRFDEAASEGVQLTRGQAEQDFRVQNDEQSLYGSSTGEGERARQFRTAQNDQISEAATRFRERFGATDATPAERGQAVKDAIGDLRDQGREGVSRLYRAAEAAGGGGLPLDAEPIKHAATDILIDEAVPATVKKSIEQEMARYGLIGAAEPMNEAGITRVRLDGGSSVAFRGPQKTLTVANAEDMRKAVNRLYDSDPTRASQALKPVIDDAVEQALTQAASGEAGPVSEAYRAARAAHQTQRQTFHAKDIIDNIIALKKGTQTDVVLPERVIAQTLGSGPAATTNIGRVKALLNSSSSAGSVQAWRGIQAQGLANIFEQAVGPSGAVSGARLNSAIRKFGVDKLRVLLDPADFNQLMKLQRIIGDATVPLKGTTNPSGTFTKLANFLGGGVLRSFGHIPGIGGAGRLTAALVAKARDLAAVRRTLEGITSYDGRAATAERLERESREFVQEYIRTAGSGSIIRAGLNAHTPPAQEHR